MTSYDQFGTPITINYKGEDTYKSFFGAICTFCFIMVLIVFSIESFDKLINRSDPDFGYYRSTNSRSQDEPLVMTEALAQMYIGLTETIEYKSGDKITRFIQFDPQYINGKIDFYNKGRLEARQDLLNCEQELLPDFDEKAKNAITVNQQDFPTMRCIPNKLFNFWNEPGTTEQNKITLLFEQCGGKYSKPKKFPEEIEAEKKALEEQGVDPAEIEKELAWKWT